jgi:succinate-semialdehyde dehydrogenase/glutarate-semialdehyde dehydrogenase
MRLKDPQLLRDKAYIDGEWASADSGETFEVTNPANGAVLARLPDMVETETRRAIEAANAAWPAWAAKTAKERAQVLRKWFDLMMANPR